MNNIAIVAIGYNRPKSMLRLLDSLKKSEYFDDEVPLIISIDNSGSEDVENIAKNFEWNYGPKYIKTYKKRMGLRAHILKCGELIDEFENLIIFEDDIIASPAYYNFAKQAINKYQNDDKIAGISLYNHKWNINCKRQFNPILDGNDIYFLQMAQSWGQIWMKRQWKAFRRWYEENKEKEIKSNTIPKFISGWPSSSWLKYHIKYIVETNKFFVYPKESLTTNFGDIGQHAKEVNNNFQVDLMIDSSKKYRLPEYDENIIKYDVFFEGINIFNEVGLNESTIIDLYGTKNFVGNKRYVLTSRVYDYKIIKSYGLRLRPHDLNIKMEVLGEEIFLYDTNVKKKNIFNNIKKSEIKVIEYDMKGIPAIKLIKVLINKVKKILDKKIGRG